MDKTHYERRSHEQGNYEITPTYTDQVVVTIKSLATGQTMKVYLDQPTQSVDKNGINVTRYTGHFDEEEFMVTWSEGIEVTDFPLVYPYNGGNGVGRGNANPPDALRGFPFNGETFVVDTQNHSLIYRHNYATEPENIASGIINYCMMDFLIQGPSDTPPTSGNMVIYDFTRFGTESDDTFGPVVDGGGNISDLIGGGTATEQPINQN